ncbi:hypothetical protein F2P81_013354 [Scophthalmus maximus]|uniref:Uncharacterized protein n=1 Tax=Scophthalmus maximus TaxID=52904 RepID=A0A6A4SK35_SCOMX|nr:hypothetical protein F2P81_013354 [Scophthalmus maximus]
MLAVSLTTEVLECERRRKTEPEETAAASSLETGHVSRDDGSFISGRILYCTLLSPVLRLSFVCFPRTQTFASPETSLIFGASLFCSQPRGSGLVVILRRRDLRYVRPTR